MNTTTGIFVTHSSNNNKQDYGKDLVISFHIPGCGARSHQEMRGCLHCALVETLVVPCANFMQIHSIHDRPLNVCCRTLDKDEKEELKSLSKFLMDLNWDDVTDKE